MLRPAPHIRYHNASIRAAHWIQFVRQYKRWIRPVVFENVRFDHYSIIPAFQHSM
jgi:hypothetical protein